MCEICENHDDYYKGKILDESIGFGMLGELIASVIIDPETASLDVFVDTCGFVKDKGF